MRVIDLDEAVTLLEKVVADRGEDFIYEKPDNDRCLYAYAGEPSCGVGYAIFLADRQAFEQVVKIEQKVGHSFPASDFSDEFDNEQEVDDYGYNLEREQEEVESVDLRFTPQAATLMVVFQQEQDNGEPYGNALYRAKRAVEIA